jgi:predicted nucleic acid-binding protein
MHNTYIVDASVAVKWLLEKNENYRDEARALYSSMKKGEIKLIAPTFLLVEILNILFKKKKVETEKIQRLINGLRNSGIVFVDTDQIIKNETKLEKVVFKYKTTAYDSLYLLLAQEEKCKLLTFDDELLKIKNLTVDLKSFE